MILRSILITGLVALTGCAFAIDKSIQDLTIETPGAQDAICYVYVDSIRYKYEPPQTMVVGSSKEDLVVDCYAPGNRHRKVYIEPQISEHAHMNVANAGIGYAWDSLSGALYKYPEVVYVDFTQMPITAEELPAQNNPDVRHPDDYDLEEFRPGSPRMREDRDFVPVAVEKRKPAQPIFSQPTTEPAPATTDAKKSSPVLITEDEIK
jgi:hypothetical protein